MAHWSSVHSPALASHGQRKATRTPHVWLSKMLGARRHVALAAASAHAAYLGLDRIDIRRGLSDYRGHSHEYASRSPWTT